MGSGGFLRVPGYLGDLRSLWLETLYRGHSEWRERMGFHFVGTSWSTDIETGNLAAYHMEAARRAALLRTRFPGLVETLLTGARLLPQSLPLRPRHANLGPFWGEAAIVLWGENRCQGGTWHADLEGLAPYPACIADSASRACSAVLVLQAPEEGGELQVRPEGRISGEEVLSPQLVLEDEIVSLPVADGDFLLFDSFLLHRVAPFSLSDRRPHRITAMMHFLLRPDPYPHWEYWC